MNKEPLELAYEKYHKELYLYALSLCKDEELAKDLVSDTFYKSILTVQVPHGAIKYWLFRVLKNLLIDHHRKNRRYQPLEDHENFIARDDSPLKVLLNSERDLKIYEKVLNLTPSIYREVIIMFYYGGLGIEEISKTLDTTPAIIKNALYRARKKLRKIIKEDSYEF